MPRCIIDGCPNEGIHNFGVRCRRPDTTAIWAPNTSAFLCDEHAEQGCIINVTITPTTSGMIETNITNGSVIRSRTTLISHDADE